jgi:hypothetical protein
MAIIITTITATRTATKQTKMRPRRPHSHEPKRI